MTKSSNPDRKRQGKLFLRIFLPIVLILIVSISALSWHSIHSLTSSKRQDLLNRNQTIAKQVAFAVQSAFYTLNWDFIETLLDSEIQSEEVLWLTILNPDHEVYIGRGQDERVNCLKKSSDHKRQCEKPGLSLLDQTTFLITEPIAIGNETWMISLGGSLESISRQKKDIIVYNLRVGLIIVLLSCLTCLFVSRRITRPIVALADYAEDIAHGKFGVSIPVSSADEIGKLTDSFNRMSSSLLEFSSQNKTYSRNLEKMVEARTRDLQLTTNQLTSILETSTQGFWQGDNEAITEKINPRLAEIFGREEKDIVGHSIMEFLDDENQAILTEERTQRDLGKQGSYEISVSKNDGSLVPCLVNAIPLYDAQSKKIGSIAMVSDISWLKEAETGLRKARDEAETASQAKSSFLANMSHEIRTPMNSIIGRTRLALDNKLDRETRSHLEMISSSADNLLALISDILDFSKIEAGELRIDNKPFDLHETVETCLKTIHVLLEDTDKGVELRCTIAPDVPQAAIGDALRLRQILLNLLSNSVKFTEQGYIELFVDSSTLPDGSLLLQCLVQDTGIGIGIDEQENIFGKFIQESGSITTIFGGTGLGLAICRELCHLMGGDIELAGSSSLGSTFMFTLCLQPCDVRELPASSRKGSSEKGPVPPQSVLLVDDNEPNMILARMVLEKNDHRISEAHDGLQALNLLAKQNYDVVLMDVQMPVMDGLTCTRIIRDAECGNQVEGVVEDLAMQLASRLSGGHVPIVAMTANAMSGDKEKCLAAGMDAYLSKPFVPEAVESVFHKLATGHLRS
ncbi:MAG: ATP-binding protein [Thermodesulfobacteriota bacterium]